MSENAIAGFKGTLFVEISSVFTKVADVRDTDINIEHDPIDSTSHDDEPWEANIAGRRRFSASGEALYIAGDAAQEFMLARVLDGAKFNFHLIPQTGTGLRRYEGAVRMLSWAQTMPNDDVDAVAFEMKGTGALADGTQP